MRVIDPPARPGRAHGRTERLLVLVVVALGVFLVVLVLATRRPDGVPGSMTAPTARAR